MKRRRGHEGVYIIGDGNLVKIGYATDLSRRIEQLFSHYQSAVLLATINAPRCIETAMHLHMEVYRSYKEWFTCPWIDAVKAAASCGVTPHVLPYSGLLEKIQQDKVRAMFYTKEHDGSAGLSFYPECFGKKPLTQADTLEPLVDAF